MAPSTLPMFVLGITNKSLILLMAGIAVLVLYVLVGLKQLKSEDRVKKREPDCK
jgi:hypothetical protein